jgi:hypothetical protein
MSPETEREMLKRLASIDSGVSMLAATAIAVASLAAAGWVFYEVARSISGQEGLWRLAPIGSAVLTFFVLLRVAMTITDRIYHGRHFGSG